MAFPGGKCDGYEEDDYTATKREILEEIGIDLEKKAIFLGKLPFNFNAYKSPNGKIKISVHLFLLIEKTEKF